jgi:hypothetical protein
MGAPDTAQHTLAVHDMRRVRAGSSLGFTLYAQFGDDPAKDDPYLGVLNNPILAQYAVTAINGGQLPSPMPWLAIGRLIYPMPGMNSIDDFIGVMATPAIARWVAHRVATAKVSEPPP